MQQPGVVPLVILRGSGDSTRELGELAARHGVRTLAHADGGGVLYVDASADRDLALELIGRSLDRLGVCNRLNLLLLDASVYDELLPDALAALDKAGVSASLPPHEHALGYEWALDAVTRGDGDRGPGRRRPGRGADRERGNLRPGGGHRDRRTKTVADTFMAAYEGTGVFWNAPTRLLDGFKLLQVPETGINIDKVPGPRGPVTYTDLDLRQYAVLPA